MDPNANLRQMISLASEIIANYDADGTASADDSARLAELVIALNGWISSGGFLPRVDARGASMTPCQCGECDGSEACEGSVGAKGVWLEYMPRALRAAHAAAGSSGEYPANGSIRVLVHVDCAAIILADSQNWARKIS